MGEFVYHIKDTPFNLIQNNIMENRNAQITNEALELIKLFEVEELEERVEFGKWSASAESGYSEKEGGYVKGKIGFEF
jgi:hypothetical protein